MSSSGRSLYRAILRELRAHRQPRCVSTSFCSNCYAHKSLDFMPSPEQIRAQSSQIEVLLNRLPARTSCLAKMSLVSGQALQIPEEEIRFGFQPHHLSTLARAVFEHDRHETRPAIIEIAHNEGFAALKLLTCSKQQRSWVIRFTAAAVRHLANPDTHRTDVSKNRHHTMENYLRNVQAQRRSNCRLPVVSSSLGSSKCSPPPEAM